MPDPDDRVAATLSEKRAALLEAASEPVPDLEVMTWRAGLAAGAGHALLKAVEAALKAADKWAAESARLDRLAENERDPQARIAISLRAQAFEDCTGKVRTAITTALTGKEAGDEKAGT